MNEYLDILNLPHYEPRYHPRMSMDKRAAQFASFDALLGFKEEIKEKGRKTSSKKQLTEEEIDLLNQELKDLNPNTKIKVTVFIPDSKKEGGSYQELEGVFKKIDLITQELIFQDKKKIKGDVITFLLCFHKII